MGSVVEDFLQSVRELGPHPDQAVIRAITMTASDLGGREDYAHLVVRTIFDQIASAEGRRKISLWYLLDSIAKSAGGVYPKVVEPHLVRAFGDSLRTLPPELQGKLLRMPSIWRGNRMFSESVLDELIHAGRLPPPPAKRMRPEAPYPLPSHPSDPHYPSSYYDGYRYAPPPPPPYSHHPPPYPYRHPDPHPQPHVDPRSFDPWMPDPRSRDPRGVDPRARDPRGVDPRARDPRGMDPRGVDPRGVDPRGMDPRGMDPRGMDPRGMDPRGMDPRGMDSRGMDPRGPSTDSIDSMGRRAVSREEELEKDLLRTDFEKLEISNPRVAHSLYEGLPNLCSECGLRFQEKHELTEHLAEHEVERQKQKTKGITSRPYYLLKEVWTTSRPRQFDAVQASFFEMQQADEEAKIEKPKEISMVPADPRITKCAVCGIPFDKAFNDEKDAWMYYGAIKNAKGDIVHESCDLHSQPMSPHAQSPTQSGAVSSTTLSVLDTVSELIAGRST